MQTSSEQFRDDKSSLRGYYLVAGTVGVLHLCLVAFGSAIFRVLGFEYSSVTSLVLSLLSGGMVAGRVSQWRSSEREKAAFHVLRQSRYELGSLFALPLLIGVGSSPFVPNCALSDGLLFYFEVALPGMLTGVIYGVALGMVVTRPKLAVGLYCLFWISTLFLSLLPGYTNPQIFTYGWQYGFFPGLVWDQALILTNAYYLFQAESILLALLVLQVARIWEHREKTRMGTLALTIVLATAVILSSFFHDTLRITSSHAVVDASLKNELRVSSDVRLRFAAGTITVDEQKFVVENVEWDLHDVRTRLGLRDTTQDVTIYLYQNAEELYRFVGTRSASIAKPWLGEVHITKQNLRSLKHELTHVLLREVGSFPFYNSWSTGITEGVAMAMEARYDGAQTLDQYALQLLELKYATGVQEVMSFTGFASNSAQASYVLAGSFSRFLLEHYGAVPFVKLYRSLDFDKEYGRSLAQLEAEWKKWLGQFSRTLNADDTLRARYYFGGRSIVLQPCLRLIGKMQHQAAEAMRRMAFGEADSIYRLLIQQSGSTSALEGRLLCQIDQHRDPVAMTIIDTTRNLDPISLKALALTFGIVAFLNDDTVKSHRYFDEAEKIEFGDQLTLYGDLYDHILHPALAPPIRAAWKRYFHDLYRGVSPTLRSISLDSIEQAMPPNDPSRAYVALYSAEITLGAGDYHKGIRKLLELWHDSSFFSDELVKAEFELQMMAFLHLPELTITPPARFKMAMDEEFNEMKSKLTYLRDRESRSVH